MQANNETAPAPSPEQQPVRWGRICLLISAALLVGVAATVTWLLNDTARAKALTERAVSSLTGRTLSIRGAFDFELGRDIRISAEQLTWANAPWSNGPAMLSVGTVAIAVDLRSIVQPPLLIRTITADNVQLNFEWNSSGASNWQLFPATTATTAEPQQPFQWRLLQADLQNIDLEILPPGQTDELHIRIQTLQQQQSAVDLYPGQEMTLNATAITWTNPGWATEPNLLQVAAAEATFDFDSLLQPPLVLSDFTARDAQLDLEWDAEGRFNGQFGTDSNKPEKSDNPLPLLLDKANLRNVAVRIRHPSQSEALLIDVQQFTQHQDASQRLITDIDAIVDGNALTLQGQIGPFPELLRAGAVDFALAANGLGTTLRLLGKVAKLADLQKPNFRFDWNAPEVEKLFAIFNVAPAATGQAALRGFVLTGAAGLNSQIDGAIGEFAVSGSLQAANISQLEDLSVSNLDGLRMQLQSTGPSARAAGKLLTIDGLPPEPYELNVQVQDTAAGLQIEAMRFATAGGVATASGLLQDFPALDKLDLDLQVNVADIARFSGLLPGEKIPSQPLRVEGTIRSNAADSNDSVTASVNLGPLQAKLTGTLTEKPRFADSGFDWTLTAPDAQKSGAIFGLSLLRTAPLNASGKATVNPASLSVRETVVKLGTHTARLNGQLPLTGGNAALQLDGKLGGANLRDLINLFAATQQVPALPYNVATQLRYANSKLELQSTSGTVGSNTLKAVGSLVFGQDWPVTNLQLSAAGPHLDELLPQQNFAQLSTGAYTASGGLKLASGSTQISQLLVQTDSGVIRGSLTLGWPADPERVDFDVTAKGTNLRTVMPAIDGYVPAAVPFDIAARGKLEQQQVDIPQLVAKLGDARINLQGNLDFRTGFRSNGAVLKASGPRVSDLGTGDAWPLPEARFDIAATLAGAADKLDVRDFSLKFGPSDLRGSMQLTRAGKLRVDIVASANQLDVRPFEALYSGDAPPKTAATPAGAETTRNKREREAFIPEVPVPLNQLDSVDGSLQLTAGKFISSRFPFQNLNVTAKLADGNLDFAGSSAFGGNGNIKVTLELQQQKGRAPHAEFSTTARNVQYELNQLDQSLQGYNLIQNIDAYLVGDGANLREIAASLDGYLWLRGGGQKIATNQFGFFFGDFLTGVLDKINPFAKKEPYQTVQCVVAFFEATEGVLKTSPAVLLSTDKLNIGAAGTINLQNEKLALNVRADPRTGVGISASSLLNPFVGLRGTLAKPQISLDPKGTLIEGGAAVATGGLSIVAESLYKRWFSSRDPCARLAEDARKSQQKRDPAHVPAD